MSNAQSPLKSGAFLLKQLAEKRIDKKELNHHQRLICIGYLVHEQKYTHREMAEIIGVHPMTAYRMTAKLSRIAAMSLDAIDQRSVAVKLIQSAERIYANLMRAGKDKEAWSVQKELIESLQNLGFISRKPLEIKFEGRLTLKEVLELAYGSAKAADTAADIGPSTNGFHQNGSHPSVEDAREP